MIVIKCVDIFELTTTYLVAKCGARLLSKIRACLKSSLRQNMGIGKAHQDISAFYRDVFLRAVGIIHDKHV